ncbi:MAG: protein kinase domain-containing protein [Methylomagnum sp.]
MPIVYSPRFGKLEINHQPFAKGGEGAVHKLIHPPVGLHDHCAKLYFDKYRNEDRHKKLEFMVRCPPADLRRERLMVCWPVDIIFDDANRRRFLGFLMPSAWPDSASLYGACLSKPSLKSPSWLAAKFDRATPAGRIARLKLIVNIAGALHSIHASGNYVLVDMKPQNVLLTHDAKIAIVDLDSIQIMDDQDVLFRAQVATPEYTPPEATTLKPDRDRIPESWDRFSIAVIFYQLLLGLHPYSASFKGDYADVTTPTEAIQQGLFVHGSKRHDIHALPSPHLDFNHLDSVLKELFIRAFDMGFRRPRLRPSAKDWGETIYSLLITAGLPTADQTYLTPQVEQLLKKGINSIQSFIQHLATTR